VKKGRHRRFEEARALKQAFDLGVEPGSTLMDAPFDPDADEFAVRQHKDADWSDLNLVLWLGEAPSPKLLEAVSEAVDDWYGEVTAADAGGVLHDFQDKESGQSMDGRHFIAWWADMGTLTRSVIVPLTERFAELREDEGLALIGLDVGGPAQIAR
jgi:hypothetical protein